MGADEYVRVRQRTRPQHPDTVQRLVRDDMLLGAPSASVPSSGGGCDRNSKCRNTSLI